MSLFSDLGSLLGDVQKMADEVNAVKDELVSSATQSIKTLADTKDELVKDAQDIADGAKEKVHSVGHSIDGIKKPGSGSN